MKIRFGACGVAAVCGVFLSACAQSQQEKPGQPTPGPVVYAPRAAATPRHRQQSIATPATSPSHAGAQVQRGASARPPASPAVTHTQPPSRTARPLATPQTVPSGSAPVSVATLSPSQNLPTAIVEPPNAPPQILAVELSSPEAHGGEVVSGTVQTSSNVASVEARIAGQSAAMEKTGVGRFSLSYKVPYLPFWMHKTYLIQLIARNTQGLSVSTAVPITIR